MRIETLDLLAFGPFDGTQLSFDQPAPGLHVLLGPNEAGKSSLRRAILALLFGIPETTGDNFRHANKNLRLGATLCDDSGGRLSFWRRKGRKNTLLDRADSPLGEDALVPFLAGLDEAAFTQLFCLDHVRLRHGGAELLAGGGSLGESLFEAASGVVSLRKTLKALEDEAGLLFREKAANPRINAALRKYELARKSVREHSVRSDEWVKLSREHTALRERQSEAEAALRRAALERERWQRAQRNRPLIERRHVLLAQLGELEATPLLPADAPAQRLAALQERAATQSAWQLCQQRISQLREELAALPPGGPLLALAGRLHELYKNLGSYRDAERDLPKRQTELAVARERAAFQWTALRGPQAPLEQADSLRLPRPQAARLRELIKQHETLTAQLAGHLEQSAELEADVDTLRQQAARLPELVDTAALAATVEAVKGLGNIGERVRQGEADVDSGQQQLTLQLRPLGGDATLDAFAQLPVPAREAVEAFEQEQRERHEARKRLDEAAQRLRQEIAGATAERERLEATGEIPTVGRLREVRQQRDASWREVRDVWVERRVQLTSSASAELLGRYEHETADADRVSDLLRSDSKRAAQAEALDGQLEQRNRELRHVTERSAALEAEATARRLAWSALWQGCGVEPRSPREMAGWLTRRDALLKDKMRHDNVVARLRVTRHELRHAEAQMRRALSDVAGTVHDEHTPLATLLVSARQILDDMASRRERHAAVDEKRLAREQTLATLHGRGQRARQALEQWQLAWRGAVQPLCLAHETSPREVEVLLDGLEQVFQTLGEVAALQHRISGMSATLTRYREDVAILASELGNAAITNKVDECVESLYRQLQAATKSEQQREHLAHRLAEQQTEAGELTQRVSASEARLRFLSEQAGGASLEALPQLEEAAERKRKLAASLDDVESHLLGDGTIDLDELGREVRGESAESIASQLAALDVEMARLDGERQDGISRAAETAAARRHIDGSERAAAAAQEMQEALSDIRDGAEEYARLQASTWLLRRAIDEYRDKHQGPLLKRAGQLFARLTGGSFCGLRPVYDEHDRAVLMGLRPSGDEVAVDGMSEGTVDQLFLSLRLAAIERRLERGETVPLVLDDILIHFDDERSRAALSVLEQVARRTQVLFLTHHEHLVALARQTVPHELLRVHTLGSTTPVVHLHEQSKPAEEQAPPTGTSAGQLAMPL